MQSQFPNFPKPYTEGNLPKQDVPDSSLHNYLHQQLISLFSVTDEAGQLLLGFWNGKRYQPLYDHNAIEKAVTTLIASSQDPKRKRLSKTEKKLALPPKEKTSQKIIFQKTKTTEDVDEEVQEIAPTVLQEPKEDEALTDQILRSINKKLTTYAEFLNIWNSVCRCRKWVWEDGKVLFNPDQNVHLPEALKRCQIGFPLNDDVMNGWSYVLMHKQKPLQLYIWYTINDSAKGQDFQFFYERLLCHTSIEAVAFILNWEQKIHWTHVIFYKEYFMHFDSVKRITTAQEVTLALQRIRGFKETFPTFHPTKLHMFYLPIQAPGSNNCGPLTLMHLEFLSTREENLSMVLTCYLKDGPSYSFNSNADCDDFRIRILRDSILKLSGLSENTVEDLQFSEDKIMESGTLCLGRLPSVQERETKEIPLVLGKAAEIQSLQGTSNKKKERSSTKQAS